MLKLQAQESAEDRGKKYNYVFRIITAMKTILCILIILLNSQALLNKEEFKSGAWLHPYHSSYLPYSYSIPTGLAKT